MGLARSLRHWMASPSAVERAFPAPVRERIGEAITRAEASHSGEIRFAVEGALPWSYLRRDAPPRERAWMVFSKLHVWDTEHNNGVLLYVELADRDVEIVADRAAARVITKAEWQAIADTARERYRAGEFETGTVAAVEAIGALMARHFPLAEGAANRNELSNRPIVL
jgi:uncharacterized membrane protein